MNIFAEASAFTLAHAKGYLTRMNNAEKADHPTCSWRLDITQTDGIKTTIFVVDKTSARRFCADANAVPWNF